MAATQMQYAPAPISRGVLRSIDSPGRKPNTPDVPFANARVRGGLAPDAPSHDEVTVKQGRRERSAELGAKGEKFRSTTTLLGRM